MQTRLAFLALAAALAAQPGASTAATPAADRGKRFFESTHGGDWSCATCHRDPAAPGRHTVTGKAIEPLAPAANPKRFSDAAKTRKWFSRNCNDVLKRACSEQEESDVVAYLRTVGIR